MKKTIKTRTVNGTTEFYSEQEDKYFPQFIEDKNLIYKLDTDTFTYLPVLAVDDEEEYDLGIWGLRRLEYLKTEKPVDYNMLMIHGLWEHLVSIDKAANETEDRLMEEISKNEGVTEDMKKENQLEWVRARNNIKNRVREIIFDELIYR